MCQVLTVLRLVWTELLVNSINPTWQSTSSTKAFKKPLCFEVAGCTKGSPVDADKPKHIP
jgi:hypothetical protein